FLDESHVLIGQLGGMFNGDRARKTTLVEYGFRLPSALDNRPLKFEEFERKVRQAVFVSATPDDYEKTHAGQVVEQLVRPTGLVAILDADKEGFLRAERSLIQTIGRAARNINGKAILYADRVTDSMRRALGETERRREKQIEHNAAMGITPRSVTKQVKEMIDG